MLTTSLMCVIPSDFILMGERSKVKTKTIQKSEESYESVALHNLGCKVNSYEIEVMQQMLQEKGYTIVPLMKPQIFIL